ncbi:MAG: hypothetical protein AB8B53_08240 [Flavobacteriales bacterium]
MLEIKEVHSGILEKKWLGFGKEIYSDHKTFVPYLKQDIAKVFDPKKNRAFRNGSAKRWLLEEDGKIRGRIAGFVEKKYSKGMEQPTGGIGFFESVEDKSVAFKLLDTAIDWLKSEGMEAADGIINFGEKNMFWGVLIENYEDKNTYGMNHHPEYYKEYLEEYGFQVYYNQHVYYRDLHVPLQEVFLRKVSLLEQEDGYRVANCSGRTLEQIGDDFLTVYNNAWGGHHGFAPMKRSQAQRTMKALKPIMDRDILIFAYHFDKPVGFYINIPELNDIFKYVNGNLNWLGKLKFLYHKWRKTSNTMVGIVFGVDREYHGTGVEAALCKYCEDHVVSAGVYDHTVMTWIGDFNPKMIKVCENLGSDVYRKLATYRYLFDRNKEFKRMPKAK